MMMPMHPERPGHNPSLLTRRFWIRDRAIDIDDQTAFVGVAFENNEILLLILGKGARGNTRQG